MIVEPAIRPPAEARSFLLQLTTGCSSNQCAFCGAYLNKPFRIKSQKEVFGDIERGGRKNPETRRVFLMDGDALILKNDQLVPILKKIKQVFPLVSRISSYINGYNISIRTNEELKELYEHGLRLVYLGLESGSQSILNQMNKKATVEEMVRAVQRLTQVGIKSSVMVLLGLGGGKRSQEHVVETVSALNEMKPRYLSFLSLMLVPGTSLHEAAKRGKFDELDPKELLRESRQIIAGLELQGTIFRSNHASNYLALEGRLPQDKFKLLQDLDMALSGNIDLRSEIFRGL